jgi:S-adenosylmethionine:tRNA ribosyltransferase-isomerase
MSATAVTPRDLDYSLDAARIATHPAEPRDSARMLVVHRAEDRIEHRSVRDIVEYLEPAGALIVNETRVEAMRFLAERDGDGRTCEGLFVDSSEDGLWRVMIRGAKHFDCGDVLRLMPPQRGVNEALPVRVRMERRDGAHWLVSLCDGLSAVAVWSAAGWTPLPPYILAARQQRGESQEAAADRADRSEYQTVYARASDRPSCAAPTAGMHFTQGLLQQIEARGIETIRTELQVGPGTFRPVDAPTLGTHPMHAERCRVTAAALCALDRCDCAASLVVGTTSVRLLESLPRPLPTNALDRAHDLIAAGQGDRAVLDFTTDILIAPGSSFRWTNRLLTNFHLPRSTLLALVGALVGLDRLKQIYALAQREQYRFYSFGDAMLILP